MRVKKAMLILFAAALTVGLCVPALTALAQDGEKQELKIEIPKPQFTGTPKNLGNKLKRLDPGTGKPRKAFYVPKGTELISLNKPVTSSDLAPIIGELSFVTDGDKEAADGSFVELGLDTQWVKIDLEADYLIEAIVVWHYHSEARAYFDVIVQSADDEDFLENVQTLYNNDYDNTTTEVPGRGRDYEYIETNEGRLIKGNSTPGRFIRLFSRGNTTNEMNHYIEVEVYGRSAN